MRRSKGYEIIDEPTRGQFPGLVVSPTFPMFAFMLAGSAIGFAWFAFNAFAFGSATRTRELAIAVLTPALVAVLALGSGALVAGNVLPGSSGPYIALVAVALKLSAAYFIFTKQRVSYELYVHFGGAARNGALVLVAAIFLGRRALEGLPDFAWLVLQ
jgi:hypothetical protein